jgi:hypothetical protein
VERQVVQVRVDEVAKTVAFPVAASSDASPITTASSSSSRDGAGRAALHAGMRDVLGVAAAVADLSRRIALSDDYQSKARTHTYTKRDSHIDTAWGDIQETCIHMTVHGPPWADGAVGGAAG